MKTKCKGSDILLIKGQLKEELRKDLPGIDVQYKMAPGLRMNIKPSGNTKKTAVHLNIYLNVNIFARTHNYSDEGIKCPSLL